MCSAEIENQTIVGRSRVTRENNAEVDLQLVYTKVTDAFPSAGLQTQCKSTRSAIDNLISQFRYRKMLLKSTCIHFAPQNIFSQQYSSVSHTNNLQDLSGCFYEALFLTSYLA